MEKNLIYIYIYELNHFAVYLKLIHYNKTSIKIILQLKKVCVLLYLVNSNNPNSTTFCSKCLHCLLFCFLGIPQIFGHQIVDL